MSRKKTLTAGDEDRAGQAEDELDRGDHRDQQR